QEQTSVAPLVNVCACSGVLLSPGRVLIGGQERVGGGEGKGPPVGGERSPVDPDAREHVDQGRGGRIPWRAAVLRAGKTGQRAVAIVVAVELLGTAVLLAAKVVQAWIP